MLSEYSILAVLILSGLAMLIGFLFLFTDSKKSTQTSASYAPQPAEDLTEIPDDDSKDWLMPGFELLSYSGKIPLKTKDLNLSDSNYFGFHPETSAGSRYAGALSSPNALTMKFLEIISGFEGITSAGIVFRDERGLFRKSFKRSGAVSITGDGAGIHVPEDIIDGLEYRGCIADRTSGQTYFPVFVDNSMYGVLALSSSIEITASPDFGRITEEIKSFGEILFQSFVYDRACRDPETGFYNGMKFHSDLELLFETGSRNGTKPVLAVIDAAGKDRKHLLRAVKSIPADLNLYRISSNAVALLGYPSGSGEKRLIQSELESFSQRHAAFSLHCGWAELSSSILSPSDWLKKAGEELLDSSGYAETNAQALVGTDESVIR